MNEECECEHGMQEMPPRKLSWVEPIAWLVLLVGHSAMAIAQTTQNIVDDLSLHATWHREQDEFKRDAGRSIEALTSEESK